MSDLLWAGDERAGDLFDDAALLTAMVRFESAWLDALVSAGVAPAEAHDDLQGLVTPEDIDSIAASAEGAGNPVIPLLAILRERLGQRSAVAATWLHRGLTSQDVIDTALVLCIREAAERALTDITSQVRALVRLAEDHRTSLMAGRTLTQHAVPMTFGLKAAVWLDGVLDAADDLAAARAALSVQIGGAAGTLAAPAELIARSGSTATAAELTSTVAGVLSLSTRSPWHTNRAPLTRIADAFVRCTDAWGHIANDVLTLSRPEIAELAEPAGEGRGGSSTMPQKSNPVLSVLIRRAALAAPMAGAQLHLAAAGTLDERADGAWHTEWTTLRTLSRHTVVAGSQTAELLEGLRVDTVRMRATVDAASNDLLAERDSLSKLLDGNPSPAPSSYLGAGDEIIDAALVRATSHLEESS